VDERTTARDPKRPDAVTRAAAPALERALRAAHEAGRRAHPDLRLPFEAFAAGAARRPGAPTEVAEALGRAAQGDLFLAIGCEVGAPGAWERFCGTYRERLEALLLARGAGRADAEALAADLLADLALPPPRPGPRTLLGTYDGSGSLFAWLAVILARRRARIAARRPVSLSPGVLADSAATRARPRTGGPADPLDAVLQGETEREVGAAFERAWTGLSDRERLLLVLRHRHGAKQNDIAALLGIGAPRVSRVLDRAVGKLRRALRRLAPAAPASGAGPTLWETLRDAVARHLARNDPARSGALPAPPSTREVPEDPDDA
jgi:RNA polymerase sigma factor (sigma-70 family)